MVEIRRLNGDDDRRYLDDLADVLVDCVEGGASVNFMMPFSHDAAKSFFSKVFDGVQRGERFLLAAFEDSQLLGTVQVVPATPPNQSHRADIAKLLVRRSARRRGVAQLLMESAEEVAREAKKNLLLLDTCTGDGAERLYARLGWNKLGVIPRFARYPDGTWCDAAFLWKEI